MYAVDTFRFVVPVFSVDCFFEREIGLLRDCVRYYDSDMKLSKEYQKFTLEKSLSGSYNSDILYKPHRQGILFEFSVPKYLSGTNYKTCWRKEFLSVMADFASLLSQKFQVELNYWKFIIKRVDLSYSFQLKNSLEVQRYLKYFADCQVNWKHPQVFKKKSVFETIFWKRTSDSFKFYNKYAEINNHREYHKITEEELDLTDSILRFEHTWRSKYIQTYLELPSESSITLEQFDFSMQYKYSFESHLQSLFKSFFKAEVLPSFDILKVEIEEKFGQRFRNFWSFLNEIILYGLDFVKAHTKQTTFDYRRRKFAEAGIDLTLFSEFFTKQKENLLSVDSSVFCRKNII